MKMRAALVAALAGALTLPGAAMAADAVVTADDSSVFGNANPVIQVGEQVTWSFANPGTEHNVAASSANWSFSSGTWTRNHGQHAYTFAAAGTYSYVCQLHAPGMGGTVTVLGPGQAPPPPGSPPPPGTDPTTPVPPPPDAGVTDRSAPRISEVSVRWRKRTAQVRFRLSETATVTLELARPGWRRTLRVQLARGRRTVSVPRLKAARYEVALRARDASGNRSPRRSLRTRP